MTIHEYLDQLYAKNIKLGLSPEEAHTRALERVLAEWLVARLKTGHEPKQVNADVNQIIQALNAEETHPAQGSQHDQHCPI